MFDLGGALQWSPPQSPRVHPRSRAEGALGDLGGRKEKANLTSASANLFVQMRRHQGARCACDRKQSFLTPYIDLSRSMMANKLVPTNTRFYNGGIQACVTFPKEIKEN
jgi:hypothetical protein